jgi:hypothetical protein
MAFDVPEAFASDVELTPGCFLGLLHEDMEHGDRPADAHDLGVRRPELGTVIFEEVEQLNCFSARRLRLFRSIRLQHRASRSTGQSSMSSRTRVL